MPATPAKTAPQTAPADQRLERRWPIALALSGCLYAAWLVYLLLIVRSL